MSPQQIVLLAAEASTGRVFGLDQQTLIQIGIQLINTSILAAVMSYLLYNPVRNILKKRTDKIKSQLSSAENDMADANVLKAEYEKKLHDIEREREEILRVARKQAEEKSRQVLAEAENDAVIVKKRAVLDIQLEQERVKDEMKQSIIDLSSVIAAKFVTQTIDKETQDKFFNKTVAELEDMIWRN